MPRKVCSLSLLELLALLGAINVGVMCRSNGQSGLRYSTSVFLFTAFCQLGVMHVGGPGQFVAGTEVGSITRLGRR